MIILPHIKFIFFMQRRKVLHFKVYQECKEDSVSALVNP
jgi:hypothetical protein